MPRVRVLPTALLGILLWGAGATAVETQTLRGSRASVDRIHRQALDHRLEFYETPAAVRKGVASGRLVRLSPNRDFRLEGVSYPYVLPSAGQFVERLAKQYRSNCGEKLVVTSAMRPRTLRLVNSSDRSVHPTGMAIDLRRPAKPQCLAWLRTTLLALEAAGAIEAVEERNPPHFHVAVFPRPYRQYVMRQGGRPASEAAPTRVVRASQRDARTGTATYRVRRGDSLWSIAQRHGRSVDEIKRANGMTSNRIVVDQVLSIPSAR
jgi:LysM repeat protein